MITRTIGWICIFPIVAFAAKLGFWRVDGDERKDLPSIGSINFGHIYKTHQDHMFDQGTWEHQIVSLNNWAKTIVSHNPFGLPGHQVPWTDLSNHGSFVTLTLKQMAYIAIIVLHSPNKAGDTPFQSSLSGITYYSVMAFLMGIKDNPSINSIHVAATQGGWSPWEAEKKLWKQWQMTPSGNNLNVCDFDDSTILVTSKTNPLKKKYCHTDSIRTSGHDYMSDDVPGQAVVDILGAFYSGGASCTGCEIANTQDESLAVFYPETTIFSFFSRNNNNQNKIFVRRAITFLGVRKYLDKQSGSNIFTHSCGRVGKNRPRKSLLQANITVNAYGHDAHDLKFYYHSMVGLASCCVGCKAPHMDNRRNGCAGGSGAGTPTNDIFTWFGAFNPNAYNDFINPIFGNVVRRIGTGPWGAGVWKGDTQQYFLIVWAGTILNGLTLDYYIYQSYCERKFEGCGLYGGDHCHRCWTGNWPTKRCGQIGITRIVNKLHTVGAIYQGLLKTEYLEGVPQIFDHI